MANVLPESGEKKRVKVYELRENDWFDRGTGFCTGRINGDESKIVVESEDQPERILLDTKIVKDDIYQKQQEAGGVDMALSFQEADGCASIWEFVNKVQQHLLTLAGPDDALSDGDLGDGFAQNQLALPAPDMGTLEEIESSIRTYATTQHGRDSLAKFLLGEDYVRKLIPFVEMSEDLESLRDLHHLCNIMKMIILLNDSSIIDHIVNEDVIMGVVGALEYDPEFPKHKANHRKYLQNRSRYKEVISIADESITKKIHATWRLTYLKDVVLARILDDPTFGVLNSLIFFNQVDIISHLQTNPHYLEELFGIIDSPEASLKKKKDAVGFIQSCCAIAKSLQQAPRAQLYNNFIQHGLVRVITFAIQSGEASLRVAGADILVAMIDHDSNMVRAYILRSINEGKQPLSEILIQVLLNEVDIGVRAQAADAIKVLLDPQIMQQPQAQNQAQGQGQGQNGEFLSKLRGQPTMNPAAENFISHFYDNTASKLFQPLQDLGMRKNLKDLTVEDVQLLIHLIDIVMYLCRTHTMRSKLFVFSSGLSPRILQLCSAPQRPLQLAAVKFLRQCIGQQDDHHNRQIIQHRQLEPVLGLVEKTMPRDNLFNSACLEVFDFIKAKDITPLIRHLGEEYSNRMEAITYVDIFKNILTRHAQLLPPEADMTLFSDTPNIIANGNQRWQGMKDMDADEEAYFNNSDDEDELATDVQGPSTYIKRARSAGRAASSGDATAAANGVASSPMLKSLVDYPDDEDDPTTGRSAGDAGSTTRRLSPVAAAHILPSSPAPSASSSSAEGPRLAPSPMPSTAPPPEKLSEKRRREEEDDDDDLGRLSSAHNANSNKRRNSGPSSSPSVTGSPSASSTASSSGVQSATGSGGVLRRKRPFISAGGGSGKASPPTTSGEAAAAVMAAQQHHGGNGGSGSGGGSGIKIEFNLGGRHKANKGLDQDHPSAPANSQEGVDDHSSATPEKAETDLPDHEALPNRGEEIEETDTEVSQTPAEDPASVSVTTTDSKEKDRGSGGGGDGGE